MTPTRTISRVASAYTALNRDLMLKRLERVLIDWFPHVTFEPAVSCHHNHVAEEQHFGEELLVTRKAIRAGLGELGIIPAGGVREGLA